MKITDIIKEGYDIPRNQMPQIHADDLENTHNVKHGTMSITKLKPAQSQRVPGLVDKTAKSIEGGFNKPIMIDREGYVINGHHRYDAYKKLGINKVPVSVVTDATLQELIDQFSHKTSDEFAEERINELAQADLDQLEKTVDNWFAKVGIDVEFTRHFLDRVNDNRNQKPITMSELVRLFKQEYKKWGKPIAQMGPDAQAVMKDMQTDINVPFVLVLDPRNNELDLVAKTIMRKKDFKTPNKTFDV